MDSAVRAMMKLHMKPAVDNTPQHLGPDGSLIPSIRIIPYSASDSESEGERKKRIIVKHTPHYNPRIRKALAGFKRLANKNRRNRKDLLDQGDEWTYSYYESGDEEEPSSEDSSFWDFPEFNKEEVVEQVRVAAVVVGVCARAYPTYP